MSISDVVSRVSAIQQQLQQLQSGTLLDSVVDPGTGSSTSSTDSSDSASSFADALQEAQGTSSTDSTTDADSSSSTDSSAELDEIQEALDSNDASADSGITNASDSSDLDSSSLESALLSALTSSSGTGSAASTASSGTTLPSGAQSLLTSDQQQFASALSAQTGLNPGVVSAWLLAEESGNAAQSRQASDNNDWLNIGYTGSGTHGSGDSVWSNPTTAAAATAEWLKGEDSIPGYGAASTGVQSILGTVGDTPQQQIAALQGSGWSASGYPSLDSLYQRVTE